MKRREFVQLAHVYDPKKHSVNGWFASEKLDGMRALWDGGLTRGMLSNTIPFANTQKDKETKIATGLWSRQGKIIFAPDWFLDSLPRYPLDGELTAGVGSFQQTMSTVRKHDPIDYEWQQIKYHVFDLPDYSEMFRDGKISTPNWSTIFSGIPEWVKNLPQTANWEPKVRRFETVEFLLFKHLSNHEIIVPVEQTRLPFTTDTTMQTIERLLTQVTSQGGEGLVLRNHNSVWEPMRTNACLKVKPFEDCEVTVTGYISGRETDRGSKLLGLMGAMITDFNGKRLELSGFTDLERQLRWDEAGLNETDTWSWASTWASNHPGQEVPVYISSQHFPRGSKVTIRYRELTNDGIPKEARYYRKKIDE